MQYPQLIFVYGTLLRGFSNHHLMRNCSFLGAGRTLNEFALFVADYPVVVSSLQRSYIYGEVYSVPNEETMLDLDALENHPNWYERRLTPISYTDGNGVDVEIDSWLYFNDKVDLAAVNIEFVTSGRFVDSQLSKTHSISATSPSNDDLMTFPLFMFVYGTLMKGFSNHYYMQHCQFIGKAHTVERYAMYANRYPFVVASQHQVQIQGEVYSVPSREVLAAIDRLEGHPDYYERRPVPVFIQPDGSSEEGKRLVTSQLYFNDRMDMTEGILIEGGGYADSELSLPRRIAS